MTAVPGAPSPSCGAPEAGQSILYHVCPPTKVRQRRSGRQTVISKVGPPNHDRAAKDGLLGRHRRCATAPDCASTAGIPLHAALARREKAPGRGPTTASREASRRSRRPRRMLRGHATEATAASDTTAATAATTIQRLLLRRPRWLQARRSRRLRARRRPLPRRSPRLPQRPSRLHWLLRGGPSNDQLTPHHNVATASVARPSTTSPPPAAAAPGTARTASRGAKVLLLRLYPHD